MGLTVDCVYDGLQAVAAVDEKNYDLILMDLQMPHMDGLEATRQIRAKPGFDSVPIIALTALTAEEDRKASEQVGMNDWLTKPVTPDQLFNTLAKYLSVVQ
ncbi:MAG: response regulator [Verrucomicrobia bacterium]|nr:response regulator [Verrucomicrobiota bacterium]